MKKIAAEKFLNQRTIKSFLEKTRCLKVLVAGDLILDRFLWGHVRRISPEAPVPVVEVKRETALAGGAGNVCLNLADAGAAVTLLARMGKDRAGQMLLGILNAKKIRGFSIRDNLPTITKTRIIASSHGSEQQLVRIDREKPETLSAAELAKIETFLKTRLEDYDCVVVSDYGKGTITPSLIKALSSRCLSRGKILTVDPKTAHFHYYKKVTCLTPNLGEAALGMRVSEPPGREELVALGKKIIRELKCASLLITQGKEGMTSFETGKDVYHLPAISKEVYDVTGAGDTVIAFLTLGLAAGLGLTASAILANFAAGVVVQKMGTASVLPGELETTLKEHLGSLTIEKYQ